MDCVKLLLLGGNGFLGNGLKLELLTYNVLYRSIDIFDYDLYYRENITKIVNDLHDITHVVILASKIGAKLFETDGISMSNYNRTLTDNIYSALRLASKKFNRKFDVTFYSTSELYGSTTKQIDLDTEYRTTFDTIRSQYSLAKLEAEQLLNNRVINDNIISNLKILRPFNVYGKYLRRGVVFQMVKDAIENNVIYYSKDTVRTLTDIDFASKLAVDCILSEKSLSMNLVDMNCTVYMKDLAMIIAEILNIRNCKFIETEYDKEIQFRFASNINKSYDMLKLIMKKHVIDIKKYITTGYYS